MNELEQYQATLDKVNKLATRWVKAWGSGYSYAGVTKVDIAKNRIYFNAYLCSSGFNPNGSMDLKYFYDDTDLEVDAKNLYDKINEKRINKWTELEKLNNDPKVQEFLKLNGNCRGYNNGLVYDMSYYID